MNSLLVTFDVWLFYCVLAVVPLVKWPGQNFGHTQLKRSVLYILTGAIGCVWLWQERFNVPSVMLPAVCWLGYITASLTWARRSEPAIKDWIQAVAFIVIYFVASQADLVLTLIVLANVGVLAILWAIRRTMDTKTRTEYNKMVELYGGRVWGLLWLMKDGATLYPIGNSTGAACVFAVGTMASIMLLVTKGIVAAPALLLNFLGLCVCANRGAFVAIILGCIVYVITGRPLFG